MKTAYDQLADIVMDAPQFARVDRDVLQQMLREYRELFLAVEAGGFDPKELVKEYRQNKHTLGSRPYTTGNLNTAQPTQNVTNTVKTITTHDKGTK